MTAMTVPAPVRLTVDHQHAPLGVAVPRPALAWQVPGEVPATAYEVEVRRLDPATGEELEPPVWATGRTEIPDPPASPWLPYGGEPLVSDTDYVWRVRIWTGSDAVPSPWAASAFSTSLLQAADVVADWVEPTQTPVELEPEASFATLFAPQEIVPAGEKLRPAKLIRQDLPRADAGAAPITRARLFLSAQGVVEASIDGTEVGDTVLAPGWTSYHTYTEFEVHDVTALLSGPPRPHTLGLRLGDGWFAGRATITGESGQYGTLLRGWWQLSLTRADGTRETWGPDSTAHSTTSGPLRYSDIMIGEKRDDRLAAAVVGWDSPGFDDSAWDPVRIIPSAEIDPATALEPFRGEPVRRLMELPAARVITTPAGETVLDFGR
ncbi:alpha-L-rhamnosidase N-terminal domain-containing protein [Actinomyces ruminis]|uniref:Bacterial alpha-L-rhamnosidase N-terminal domain-containing protein n=1 Tax=Actinomyces ruminis TaxID=1937003 RepID=A0ABX4MDN3_9ACTO|nr:alpha-L-rhamnosidase N-terminal domain-containing protein [Actinomyces ruminis]PHP53556.1 hypothetical protein BW737_001840 [Actinomyces ruminis]